MRTVFIAKNKIVIVFPYSRCLFFFFLQLLLLFQKLAQGRMQGDSTYRRLRFRIFFQMRDAVNSYQYLLYIDLWIFKIDMIPRQSQNFGAPAAGIKQQLIRDMKTVGFRTFQELCLLLQRKMSHFNGLDGNWLEIKCPVKGTVGSNPTLSASLKGSGALIKSPSFFITKIIHKIWFHKMIKHTMMMNKNRRIRRWWWKMQRIITSTFSW